MEHLPDVVAGRIGLLVGPCAERETMLKIAALLALRGPVRVLDAGNGFNAYRVARHIRRQTPQLAEALERISVARAFTCYQVVTLIAQTPATQAPQLVLDLLATFADESVSLEESERLLRIIGGHLHRLRRLGPVMISARPPPQPERRRLLLLLKEAADHIHVSDAPSTQPPPTLFQELAS